jgi:Zinc knuckle
VKKDCRFKNAKCYKCQKVGHIAPACKQRERSASGERKDDNQQRSRSKQRGGKVKVVKAEESNRDGNDFDDNGESSDGWCHSLRTRHSRPIECAVIINEVPLTMEVDTGTTYSVIPQSIWQKCLKGIPLSPTSTTLMTYGGAGLTVCVGSTICKC